MGANPLHGTGTGKLSTWVRKADNGDTSEDTGGVGMEITTTGGRDGGGGL